MSCWTFLCVTDFWSLMLGVFDVLMVSKREKLKNILRTICDNLHQLEQYNWYYDHRKQAYRQP